MTALDTTALGNRSAEGGSVRGPGERADFFTLDGAEE
jgi:hypothetical protein